MSGTLLIDNYDSFTYNLYALIAETSGRPPIVVRNDEMEWAEVVARRMDRVANCPMLDPLDWKVAP